MKFLLVTPILFIGFEYFSCKKEFDANKAGKTALLELDPLVNGIRKEARSLPYTKDPDKENLPLKVFTKCEKCNTNLTGYIVKKKNLYYYKCRTKDCKTNRSAKVMHQMFLNMLNSF